MALRRHSVVALAAVAAVLAAACSSSGTKTTGSVKADSETTLAPSSKTKLKILYTPQNEAGTKLGNENIARFQRLVKEGLNEGKLQVMDELLSPTVVDHQFYGPGYPPSRAGVKGLTAALRTAFPDMHATATELVASDDGTQTFAQIETTGTNTGPYLGIPPSGRKIDLLIIESALWKDGKMIEHWGVADNITLLTQMGFFPPDASPKYSPEVLAVKFRKQLDDPSNSPKVSAPKTSSDNAANNIAMIKQLFATGINSGNMAVTDLISPNYVD